MVSRNSEGQPETQQDQPQTDRSSRHDRREGKVAKAIEEQTAKLPSDTFLWAAGGAVAASLALQLMGKQKTSNFIGQWAPTILIMGVYNKLVKQNGHDRRDARKA